MNHFKCLGRAAPGEAIPNRASQNSSVDEAGVKPLPKFPLEFIKITPKFHPTAALTLMGAGVPSPQRRRRRSRLTGADPRGNPPLQWL
jgi:hypothetical protein